MSTSSQFADVATPLTDSAKLDEIVATLGVTSAEVARWLFVPTAVLDDFRAGIIAQLPLPARIRLQFLCNLASTMRAELISTRISEILRHHPIPALGNKTMFDALNYGEDAEFLADIVRLGTGLSPKTERGLHLTQGAYPEYRLPTD